MNRTTARLIAVAMLASVAATLPLAAQQPRPDTEFCARMRAKDPGGICTAKGEYVTADRVYLPDGRIIDRATGN